MKFTEIIDEYRLACQHPRMACTSIGAVFMPTAFMIKSLNEKKEQLILDTGAASEVVDEVLDYYEILFNNQAEIVAKHPINTPEETF